MRRPIRLFIALLFSAALTAGAPTHTAQAASPKAKAAYKRGVKAGNQGKIDDAVKHFAEAARLDSRYGQAWRDLGQALVIKQRLPEAIAAYRNASKHTRRSHKVQLGLGKALLAAHLPAAAVKPLQSARKFAKAKERPAIDALLAEAHADAEEHEAAIELLTKLLKKDQWNKELLFRLATTQIRAKQFEAGAATAKKLADVDKANPKPHLLIAEAWRQHGSMDKARAAYAAACDLGDDAACMKAR